MGLTNADPTVRKAIEYVKQHQEPEGCWFGRWGVNYIYGTWQSVIGPIRCGEILASSGSEGGRVARVGAEARRQRRGRDELRGPEPHEPVGTATRPRGRR